MSEKQETLTAETKLERVEAVETEATKKDVVTDAEVGSPFEVKFVRPHAFEGKTYNSISLEGLETMTSKDMRDAESWLTKKGIVSATPEMSMEYACFIASRAADLPIEFFESLHPKNAIKVKNKVTNFFYGED